MATDLLSKQANTLCGVFERQLGTLSQRSVHPASPALLTRNGPLVFIIQLKWSDQEPNESHVFKV